MPVLNIRLTSDEQLVNRLIDELSGMDDVERAEEIADLMPHMDDPDSSSLGLRGDMGPGYHTVVVEIATDTAERRVRSVAATLASDAGAALEFVDDF